MNTEVTTQLNVSEIYARLSQTRIAAEKAQRKTWKMVRTLDQLMNGFDEQRLKEAVEQLRVSQEVVFDAMRAVDLNLTKVSITVK